MIIFYFKSWGICRLKAHKFYVIQLYFVIFWGAFGASFILVSLHFLPNNVRLTSLTKRLMSDMRVTFCFSCMCTHARCVYKGHYRDWGSQRQCLDACPTFHITQELAFLHASLKSLLLECQASCVVSELLGDFPDFISHFTVGY